MKVLKACKYNHPKNVILNALVQKYKRLNNDASLSPVQSTPALHNDVLMFVISG